LWVISETEAHRGGKRKMRSNILTPTRISFFSNFTSVSASSKRMMKGKDEGKYLRRRD